jgi:DNA modification methylase
MMKRSRLKCGDSAVELKKLPANSIDSLITDPPGGISFMLKGWDGNKGGRDQWIDWLAGIMKEAYRVMKPGAHGFVWALPRTAHWTTTALEDAGFEIRDVVVHVYGQGFPKSHNVTKAIERSYECQFIKNVKPVKNKSKLIPVELNGEKIGSVVVNAAILQGAEAESKTVTGVVVDSNGQMGISLYASTEHTDSNTTLLWKNILEDECGRMKKSITLTELKTTIDLKIWNLLQHQSTLKNTTVCTGTSLKPAAEHWILIRKPLEGTVAQCVLKHGTGALNIDASRVGTEEMKSGVAKVGSGSTYSKSWGSGVNNNETHQGRFPSNLVLSCSCEDPHQPECVCAELDKQAPKTGAFAKVNKGHSGKSKGIYNDYKQRGDDGATFYDDGLGGASRFFKRFIYQPKVSTKERNMGFTKQEVADGYGNTHPTLKSMKLMTYLITMITPPNGFVLDCFAGSGSTLMASKAAGFKYVGIEQEKEYVAIARKRLKAIN